MVGVSFFDFVCNIVVSVVCGLVGMVFLGGGVWGVG